MARPREFNQDDVNEKIMNLFWAQGFYKTSMEDLVKATGLQKGSLYKCLGNKVELFEQALLRYCQPEARDPDLSAFETLVDFYKGIVDEANLPRSKRRGCLLMNSGLEFGNRDHEIMPLVNKLMQEREQFFLQVIEEAIENGQIPKRIDSAKAARRAFATAFTIREICKFRPDREFLADLANNFFESLGVTQKVII